MNKTPTQSEIAQLFDNSDAEVVWPKVMETVRMISPAYDFKLVQSVYDDVLRLFKGEYPGYSAIKTLYHDLAHTLEVLLCGARLMHGVHVSGDHLNDDEITSILLALLMHDVGYAQQYREDTGTGAQFTRTHVQRGIEFMQQYFAVHNFDAAKLMMLTNMILSTEHTRPFSRIDFDDERIKMLARIVATADITGQMADRVYLEKLLFLYLEFKEAQFGSYQSMYDLLCQTNRFYEVTREKLDEALGGIYKKLEHHFEATIGVSRNFYLESIEKNMGYLAKIVAHDEAQLYSMLKRNGVSDKIKTLAV